MPALGNNFLVQVSTQGKNTCILRSIKSRVERVKKDHCDPKLIRKTFISSRLAILKVCLQCTLETSISGWLDVLIELTLLQSAENGPSEFPRQREKGG